MSWYYPFWSDGSLRCSCFVFIRDSLEQNGIFWHSCDWQASSQEAWHLGWVFTLGSCFRYHDITVYQNTVYHAKRSKAREEHHITHCMSLLSSKESNTDSQFTHTTVSQQNAKKPYNSFLRHYNCNAVSITADSLVLNYKAQEQSWSVMLRKYQSLGRAESSEQHKMNVFRSLNICHSSCCISEGPIQDKTN